MVLAAKPCDPIEDAELIREGWETKQVWEESHAVLMDIKTLTRRDKDVEFDAFFGVVYIPNTQTIDVIEITSLKVDESEIFKLIKKEWQ